MISIYFLFEQLGFFFDQSVLCQNLCQPSLTPKNLGQWGCSSGQFVAHVCFLGHGPPCEGPPLPKTTLCGLCCVSLLLWCGVSVRCVFKIFVGASKIWALLLIPPSMGPLLPDSSLRWSAKNFALFFPLPPQFSFFLPLLWVFSLNFGGD